MTTKVAKLWKRPPPSYPGLWFQNGDFHPRVSAHSEARGVCFEKINAEWTNWPMIPKEVREEMWTSYASRWNLQTDPAVMRIEFFKLCATIMRESNFITRFDPVYVEMPDGSHKKERKCLLWRNPPKI